MKKSKTRSSLASTSPENRAPSEYVFRLYVTGATSASVSAVVNARKFCEEYLKGRYQMEVLNIAENVIMATQDQIVAVPTLVKVTPLPMRRFIGDMSNIERILKGLNLRRTS